MLLAAIRRWTPKPFRVSVAVALFEARVAARTAGRGRYASLGDDLKVNLGCGDDVRPGWLNLDLALDRPRGVREVAPGTLWANHDLREGLPLRPGSCRLIYTSHFLEHLAPADAIALLSDCRSALAEGARLRVAVPDFGPIAGAYARGELDHLAPLQRHVDDLGLSVTGPATPIDALDYAAHQAGEHKQVYDSERLAAQLREAGFTRVQPSDFDPELDVDNDLRRRYSVYMDAYR
jgi:predicted SAM-dependent methyltransferase